MGGILVRIGTRAWPAIRTLLVALGILDAAGSVLGGDGDGDGKNDGAELARTRVALVASVGLLGLLVVGIAVLGLLGKLRIGGDGRRKAR